MRWLKLIGILLGTFINSTIINSTIAQEIGSGLLRLTDGVSIALETYMDEGEPLVFVVTTDGRYARWKYCPAAFCQDLGHFQSEALSNCEDERKKRGIKAPCRVFAIEDTIVWDGPIRNLPKSLREDGPEESSLAGIPQTATPSTIIEDAEQEFAAITVGQSVSNPAKLGAVQIPLPGDNWIVIAKRKSLKERSGGDVLTVSLIFAQVAGNTLRKVVSATTVGARTNEFKSVQKLKACKRNNMLFRKTRLVERAYQDCWYVNHTAFFKKQKRNEYWERAFAYFEKRGISAPTEMPYVGFRMANGERWITLRYYWSAEADGILPKEYENRKNSDWYKYNIEDHPRKIAYIEKLKKWGTA